MNLSFEDVFFEKNERFRIFMLGLGGEQLGILKLNFSISVDSEQMNKTSGMLHFSHNLNYNAIFKVFW